MNVSITKCFKRWLQKLTMHYPKGADLQIIVRSVNFAEVSLLEEDAKKPTGGKWSDKVVTG